MGGGESEEGGVTQSGYIIMMIIAAWLIVKLISALLPLCAYNDDAPGAFNPPRPLRQPPRSPRSCSPTDI